MRAGEKARVTGVGAVVKFMSVDREYAVAWMQSSSKSGPMVLALQGNGCWIEVSETLLQVPFMVELLETSIELRRRTIDDSDEG
jgi:hypothetical protein